MDLKDKRIRIIALFMLSNICSYLMAISDSSQMEEIKITEKMIRPDYVNLVISAELKTDLNFLEPMVLTNYAKNLYIPHLFIHKKMETNSTSVEGLTEPNEKDQFLVSVHKKFLNHIINAKGLVILPQVEKEIIVQKQMENKYEVTL